MSEAAIAGTRFSYQVLVTGRPTSFTAFGPNMTPLPNGITIDSQTGILSGTFATPGTYTITVVGNSSTGTASTTLSITVAAPPAAGPVISSGAAVTARSGQRFSFQVITKGGTSATRLSISGLPAGLSFDPVTGIISGTPTSDGSSAVILTVRDGNVGTSASLQLTFSSDPALPIIVSSSSASLTSGQPFTYTIKAPSSADPSDPTIFTLIGTLPPGLTFDAKTGTISGTFTGNPQQGDGPVQTKLLSGGVISSVQISATNSHGTATTPLNFFVAPSGTVNISTRIPIGTGENVLIGGFIVTGNAPKKVIIRGIGPSLKANGTPVAGTLQDPTLELHLGSGAVLASNDNWRTDQEQEIKDSTIPPTDDREPPW